MPHLETWVGDVPSAKPTRYEVLCASLGLTTTDQQIANPEVVAFIRKMRYRAFVPEEALVKLKLQVYEDEVDCTEERELIDGKYKLVTHWPKPARTPEVLPASSRNQENTEE